MSWGSGESRVTRRNGGSHGELPSSPIVCTRISRSRILIAIASAVVVNVRFIQRNNWAHVRVNSGGDRGVAAYQGYVGIGQDEDTQSFSPPAPNTSVLMRVNRGRVVVVFSECGAVAVMAARRTLSTDA
jgi:hypothetical protein